jgi:hypothetical protein
MIRIAITAAAFDAVATTLPLGAIGFERDPADEGERLVWLEPSVLNRLRPPARATATPFREAHRAT